MKVLEIMANFVQIGQTAKDELKKKSDKILRNTFWKPWLKDSGEKNILAFYSYRGKNQTTNHLIIAPPSFRKMCFCE